MCENQLISSQQHYCTQNSERLLWTPADEKDGLRKLASSSKGAVSTDTCVEDWVVPLSWRNQIWQSEKEGVGQRGLEF